MRQKGRVFSLSNRQCPTQPSGGPGGVNYRLLNANRNYQYIENMIHIFEDVVVEKDALHDILILGPEENEFEMLKKYLLKLNSYYRFTDDDVYFFHDPLTAFIFITLFKVNKTVLVYHQQGTLYKEFEYITGEQNKEQKIIQDSLLTSAFLSVKYTAFPSRGSIESLIASDMDMANIIDDKKIKILYNGFDNPGSVEPTTQIMKQTIEELKVAIEPIFVTVAFLNEAKGVERIPEFLAQVKMKYGAIRWVIVGDGVKAVELQENISRYDLDENVIWMKDKMPHDDILALFQYTDFYILAHRFSIFDFSTIEAMSYGNIPILTPVGGNKEVIIEDNGIFINDLSNTKDFDEYVANHQLDDMKMLNQRIADQLFSEKAFLKAYADLADELQI